MKEYQIRNRHRLRKKTIRELERQLGTIFSTSFNFERSVIDSAVVGELEVFIIDNEVLAWIFENKLFLTLRGLLKFKPEHMFVTVDMGAVRFISNGADVMEPGVTDADIEIQVGEPVWVRDEKNHQPLVVGISLMTGEDMITNHSDKAVKSFHYVGDNLWNIKI